MIWIHIGAAVGVLLLGVGGRLGFVPYKKYVTKHEYYKILLIIFAGNLMGCYLTWQNNQGRILTDGAYLERPAPGNGDTTKQFLVETEEGELSVALSIPQQPGGEEETAEPQLSAEESMREAIRRAAAALNEEKQESDKYYLPSEVNGQHIRWSYPVDHSGMMILSLTLLAGFLLMIAKERRKEQEAAARKEQMLRDYPNLVTKLCLLVQAGMTMRRAFGKTALDYRRSKRKQDPPRFAYEEMLVAYYEMESGVLETQAYENFGRRCGQVPYRTLATLLSQNIRKGSQGLVDILERESFTAFEDRKRQARIQGEAAATKLLIPMVLMLLVVLVILMVPAFLSFYG